MEKPFISQGIRISQNFYFLQNPKADVCPIEEGKIKQNVKQVRRVESLPYSLARGKRGICFGQDEILFSDSKRQYLRTKSRLFHAEYPGNGDIVIDSLLSSKCVCVSLCTYIRNILIIKIFLAP